MSTPARRDSQPTACNLPYTLHPGDCLDSLRAMPDCSIDSVVCDPPYGLSDHRPDEVLACLSAWIKGEVYKVRGKGGFMGKAWDAWVPGPEVWRECLRVLKPGGHLLAFAGTRSMDLMCMAVRLAGFELRDSIGFAHDGGGAPVMGWAFGSGFPKSRNLDGAWQGWGTALKPAWEPIVLARKPLVGTVADTVMAHGTGALNIDGCRVAAASEADEVGYRGKCASVVGLGSNRDGNAYGKWTGQRQDSASSLGRWPANLIHDGSEGVLAEFPHTASGIKTGGQYSRASGVHEGGQRLDGKACYGDAGSAARFFYCAKASKADRGEGNVHPTVKPTDLMRYLCRLVTPPGGVVLDPFMGSGTTGKAAMLEGFRFIGCEREPEYLEIARARIAQAHASHGAAARRCAQEPG